MADTAIGLDIFSSDATRQAPLGAIVEYNDPTWGYQLWRYVKNGNGSALNEGDVVTLKAAATTWEVVKSPVASDAVASLWCRLAGVAQYEIPDGEYGWVLVSGVGSVRADAAVAITATEAVMTSDNTAGTGEVYAADTNAEARIFASAIVGAVAGALATCKIAIPV